VDTDRHRLEPAIQVRVSALLPSPTFGPGILATAVGTSSWRASPAVENAFVDDTDVVAAATFFFVTDDTFMPTFKLLPL
jgi:hypothetical protein